MRRYGSVIKQLLHEGQLTGKLPAAMVEHGSVGKDGGDTAGRAERVQTFVSKPNAGTETLDLLMCAASAGNASAVDALLQAGEPPVQFNPFSQPHPGFR